MSNFALPMDLPGFDAAVRDTGSTFAPSRLAAAVSFSLADDPRIDEAIHCLHGLLNDPVPEIRAQAVESLATLASRGGKPDRDKCAPLLNDPYPEVAAAVLQSGELLLSQPEEAALSAADSTEEILRYSAALLLGTVDNPQAHGALCKLLEDSAEEVRIVAALQLGNRGNAQSVQILQTMVQQGHPASLSAIEALASPELPVQSDVLRALATKRFGSKEHRALALAALARREGPPHGDTLVNQLQSRRKSLRLAALRACAAIPVADFAEPLAAVVQHPRSDEDASAALYALCETVRLFPHVAPVLTRVKPHLSSQLQNELSDYTANSEPSTKAQP